MRLQTRPPLLTYLQSEHVVSSLPKVDLVLSLTLPLSPNTSYS